MSETSITTSTHEEWQQSLKYIKKRVQLQIALFAHHPPEFDYVPNPKKGVQILLQILKPLSNTEILTPELVGDQIKMVA